MKGVYRVALWPDNGEETLYRRLEVLLPLIRGQEREVLSWEGHAPCSLTTWRRNTMPIPAAMHTAVMAHALSLLWVHGYTVDPGEVIIREK